MQNPEDFSYQRFKETKTVRNFCCGDDELDTFLTTEEVKVYQKELFILNKVLKRNKAHGKGYNNT